MPVSLVFDLTTVHLRRCLRVHTTSDHRSSGLVEATNTAPEYRRVTDDAGSLNVVKNKRNWIPIEADEYLTLCMDKASRY